MNSIQPSSSSFVTGRSEHFLVFILAAVHVTNILDFVVMMPLAPVFMRSFDISLFQFTILLTSYTFAGSAAGIANSFFIDRFDRRKALLYSYGGFLLGTVLCALSPNYITLLLARIVTGAFSGMAGSAVFSIIGDAIAPNRRGRATGTVLGAFSIASVLGLPLGLYMAVEISWHMAFWLVVVLGIPVWFLAMVKLKPMAEHISGDHHPLRDFLAVISVGNHWRAMGLSTILGGAAFLVIPLISPYMVKNVGLTESQLPLIYLFGGLATLFTSRLVGRMADHFGALRVFVIMALVSLVPLLVITHLPPVPLYIALITSTMFMVCMNGRYVPAMTLINTATMPKMRGGFLGINSAMNNGIIGISSMIAGFVANPPGDGAILHYGTLGWFSAGFILLAIYIAFKIRSVH